MATGPEPSPTARRSGAPGFSVTRPWRSTWEAPASIRCGCELAGAIGRRAFHTARAATRSEISKICGSWLSIGRLRTAVPAGTVTPVGSRRPERTLKARSAVPAIPGAGV